MKKELRFLGGLLILSPLFALELGLIWLCRFGHIGAFVTAGIVGIIVIVLTFKVMQTVMTIGPIEYLTILNATPRLDNLKKGPDSTWDYLDLNQNDPLRELHSLNGKVRIFGDWLTDIDHEGFEITDMTYENSDLTIVLSNRYYVVIHQPEFIMNSRSYFKVVKAARIEVTDKLSTNFKRVYLMEGRKVRVLDQNRFSWRIYRNAHMAAFSFLIPFK